jgi:serine/threonine kinase 32
MRAIVNLNHFRLLRVVGRGAFGKVRIVERKDTGLSFALKYIRKDEGACAYWAVSRVSPCLTSAIVVRSESVRNIIRERRMLEHVNHPFICNLRYSFQDIEYMYATPHLDLLGSATQCLNRSLQYEHAATDLDVVSLGTSWWIS